MVVFSGAGISAECGIQTFREGNGLWENYRIEDVATLEAWQRDPSLVQEFYNQRRKQILDSKPNEAHQIIAELEEHYEVMVITQNIDDLHERAGSSNVMHLHGNIRYAKSSGPAQERAYFPIDGWELKITDLCPGGYPLRPHVVWFGEDVPMYEKALKEVRKCEILLVIGTSLQVYPAAGIRHYAPINSRKFLIDPKADNFSTVGEFMPIKKSATEGMKTLLDYLAQG